MAFNGKYEFDQEGIDQILSERGDYFLALREVRWQSNKEFKNDLRHYKSDEDGDIPLKGCAFSDDEADELVRVLLEEGFGDNNEIAAVIAEHRPGIGKAIKPVISIEKDANSDTDSRCRLFQRRQKNDEIEMDNVSSLDDYYNPKRDLFEEETA